MDAFSSVLILGLATYGISTLLSDYDGPLGIFNELRANFSVFRCGVCLSVWVGLVLAILTLTHPMVYLAALGLSILAMRYEG